MGSEEEEEDGEGGGRWAGVEVAVEQPRNMEAPANHY